MFCLFYFIEIAMCGRDSSPHQSSLIRNGRPEVNRKFKLKTNNYPYKKLVKSLLNPQFYFFFLNQTHKS